MVRHLLLPGLNVRLLEVVQVGVQVETGVPARPPSGGANLPGDVHLHDRRVAVTCCLDHVGGEVGVVRVGQPRRDVLNAVRHEIG